MQVLFPFCTTEQWGFRLLDIWPRSQVIRPAYTILRLLCWKDLLWSPCIIASCGSGWRTVCLSVREMSLWYHNKNRPPSPSQTPVLSPLSRHLSVLIREHTVATRWENMALFCINKHHMLFCTRENTTNVMETIKNAIQSLGKTTSRCCELRQRTESFYTTKPLQLK